jgi:hypothetical protein
MAKACKITTVNSMAEFRKKYLPKTRAKTLFDAHNESQTLAVEMAKRSIKSVQKQLSK